MAHANFTPAADGERREMLAAVGAKTFDDLFAHIPAALQTDRFDLPQGMSELEMMQVLRALSARNADSLVNFCGGGFYDHFIPAAQILGCTFPSSWLVRNPIWKGR